jgi:adenylate cyclase
MSLPRTSGALALVIGLASCLLHWQTSAPIAGLSTREGGSPVHRFVQSLEGRAADLQFRLRGARAPSPEVVLLELDERGAQRWGLWPWSRSVIATLLERLLDAEVRVVGLDIAFSDETAVDATAEAVVAALGAEGSVPPRLEVLRDSLARQLEASPDARLERALRRGGDRVVQGVIPLTRNDVPSFSAQQLQRYEAVLAGRVITEVPGTVRGSVRPVPADLPVYAQVSAQTPLARFAPGADGGSLLGHFSPIIDVDGTIRRTAPLVRLSRPAGLFPALGLQVAARFLSAAIVPVIEDGELTAIDLTPAGAPAVRVPLQEEASFTLLNYPGPKGVFRRLSSVDVFDGAFPREAVAGKAVLVGVTLTGSSGDQRVTPYEELSEGLVTHAALVSNILAGDFHTRPGWSRAGEMALMLAAGLLLAFAVPRVGFRAKVVLVLVVSLGWSLLTFLAFSQGLRLAWVVPTADLLVTSFGLIFLGYLSVDREKAQLRGTFQRYLGEDVIELALADPEKLNQGEKREMTVLFSDIRGFTSLAEHMTPERLAAFINGYLSPMTSIVFDEKGTLDKYIGDALMAFWNAPLDQPDHALRACRAAVHMLQRLEALKVGWRAAGYPELDIGIGVNTGPMVVGNMGSDVRVDYTVLGDAVNLGSRLEGTNKLYDTRIVIGETTWAQVRHATVCRRLGAVKVKGRREPVRIYELRGLGVASGTEAAAIARFEAALEAWSARRFAQARTELEAVLTHWPADPPTRLYLSALAPLLAAPPPPEWDGVLTMATK